MSSRDAGEGKKFVPKRTSGELTKLPPNFTGGKYANLITFGGTANEIYIDFWQVGPEAGGRPEGRADFIDRFIFPLSIARETADDLRNIAESIQHDIEKDTVVPISKKS